MRIEKPEEAWLFDFRELVPSCFFVGAFFAGMSRQCCKLTTIQGANPRDPYLVYDYYGKWPNLDKTLLHEAEREVHRYLRLHPDSDGNPSALEELWNFRQRKRVVAHAINNAFWRVCQWSERINDKYLSHCECFLSNELFR